MTTRQKWLALLLALVLTLGTLAGCADAPGQGSAPGAETTMEHTGTEPGSPSETQLAGIETQPSKQGWMETVPEYTGAPLIQPDPDREFYLSLVNQDCDFYPYGRIDALTGYLITKELYHISEIGITIDMENPYRVEIRSRTEECLQKAEDSGGDLFSNYHYLCMQGVDWRELGQLALDASNAGLEQTQYHANEEEFQELESVGQKYRDTMSDYQRQFEAVQEIPSFYVYAVEIYFPGLLESPWVAYDETVEELELRLGDQRIPVRFGQWRFHAQMPEELEPGCPGLQQGAFSSYHFNDCPYNGGYVRLFDPLGFRSVKDVTLTGVHSFGTDVPILGGRVTMGGQDFYWDMKTPLDVPAEQDVAIDVYFRDERFTQYEVCCTVYLVMEYELEGRTHTMTVPCCVDRLHPIWDTYLMAFEGIDLGEYYTCFYSPQYENYIWLLPEKWKK